MAQREAWVEGQRLVPALRREGALKLTGVFLLHLLGMCLFTSGFLLSRDQVDAKSKPYPRQGDNNSSGAQYDKVVVMVVDALRSDFVCIANDSGRGDESFRATRAHRRALPVFRDLCGDTFEDRVRKRCQLYEFVADAPTTTMQRIKGLTTGSLPTFVDIGSSLSAKEMEEDNIMFQLNRRGSRVHVMGDDTWVDLFPNEFSERFPFPSMEVNDLHTVDDGVSSLLHPAVQSGKDWDVLVAHYLGVDHVGHTFDIFGREMLQKLEQIDEEIRRVAKALEERAANEKEFEKTLLLVMGDHGQTETGEHGGNSHEETSTILMAYRVSPESAEWLGESSPHPLASVDRACPKVLNQLDFAATFSEMVGLPIPFSNVGQVSYDLWSMGMRNDLGDLMPEGRLLKEFDSVLARNTKQVNEYLSTFLLQQSSSKLLSGNSAEQFLSYQAEHGATMEGFESKPQGVNIQARVEERQKYLNAVANHARAIWTKFDFRLMAVGILSNVAAAVIQLRDTRETFFSFMKTNRKVKHSMVLYGLVLSMLSFAMLSNSYILSEGYMVCFLITTLLFYMVKESMDATNNGPSQICLASLLLLNAFMCHLIPEHSGDIWNGNTQKTSYQMNYLVSDALFLVATYLGLIQMRKKGSSVINVKEFFYLYASCLAVLYSFLKNRGHQDPDAVWHPAKLAKQIHGLTGLSLAWLVYECKLRSSGTGKPKGRLSFAVRAVFCLLPEFYILQMGNGRLALALAYLQLFVSIILYVKIQFFHQRIDLELICTLLFGLYAAQIFHATGHQCQFSSLQYNSAFVGFDTFNWWRGAALLSLNTWTSHILAVLLVTILYSRQHVKKQTVAFLAFGFTFSMQSIFVMLCSTIHSRHLMVWGVFAPKFIFNSIGLCVLDAMILAAYALFL